jgi:hypothetical protein
MPGRTGSRKSAERDHGERAQTAPSVSILVRMWTRYTEPYKRILARAVLDELAGDPGMVTEDSM